MTKKFSETDMYQPIKDFLTELDYSVCGEVKGCDIAAVKDDELLIVEMKLSFNMTLLYQAMDRKKMTSQVYVAIPRPRKSVSRDMSRIKEIAKKLELGLITVALDSPTRAVDVLIPSQGGGPKSRRLSDAIKKEMAGRSQDNTGGSTRVKLNTAYRERCIRIACILERCGPSTASRLVKNYGCEKDAYSILYQNHYGWFEKLGNGFYDISKLGRNELENGVNEKLVRYYRDNIEIV